MTQIRYEWRGNFANSEINVLYADAFEHRQLEDDWQALVSENSLGWVTARDRDSLDSFVNVIWDGLVHAWIQDEMVSSESRHHGIGVRLIEVGGVRVAACGLR